LEQQWPDAIKQAFNDVFLYDDDAEDYIAPFYQRWGDVHQETLVRVLNEGQGKDKIIALFTLGYLAPSGVDNVLMPFLESAERMERWASAICLGRFKDQRSFSSLQEMLLEGIFEHGPFLEDDVERLALYEWFNVHRCTAAALLGSWGNREAVPALCHALAASWKLEQQPGPFSGRWGCFLDNWHSFQDHIAYALGQLGAFGALLNLGLPEGRLRIAITYLVLGNLQVKAKELFVLDLAQYVYTLKQVHLSAVTTILSEQFGFSAEQHIAFLQQFPEDCVERLLVETPEEHARRTEQIKKL